ncbi:DUF739 family protein [Anaeromicropila populeti]|uniref:HTH cro/C1-type domain-containing protein n=1 Tax=Anaeromicropila populeti TaxID=37658 RepID=A0A1I6JPP9_9FIRM|nr:DUF739 family protein [Anaeromicropila populeti]SFR80952.1 Protein of unknown function [Anaeromicropila populeti]
MEKAEKKELKQFYYNKLLGKIKEFYNTQEAFAAALGIGRVSLSQRLNNKIEFSQMEIYNSAKLLDIEIAEISTYFYCTEEPKINSEKEPEQKKTETKKRRGRKKK